MLVPWGGAGMYSLLSCCLSDCSNYSNRSDGSSGDSESTWSPGTFLQNAGLSLKRHSGGLVVWGGCIIAGGFSRSYFVSADYETDFMGQFIINRCVQMVLFPYLEKWQERQEPRRNKSWKHFLYKDCNHILTRLLCKLHSSAGLESGQLLHLPRTERDRVLEVWLLLFLVLQDRLSV